MEESGMECRELVKLLSDMPKKLQPAEVGPWAKEKLDALKRYLDFYTKVFKNNTKHRTIYFDGFAGGGQAIIRRKNNDHNSESNLFDENIEEEEIEFIDGSPQIALSLDNAFDIYVFVDKDPKRAEELKHLSSGFEDNRKVIIKSSDCATEINWLLEQNININTHRGVAFLDPFGAHLPWNSVADLGKTKLFEVIINLPLDMAINRLLKRDNNIPQNWLNQLNEVFGKFDWHSEVYNEENNLFEKTAIEKRSDAANRLLNLYLKMLREEFNFVAKPKLIKNSKGHPLYYIIWAGQHKKGLLGAEYILGMSERLPIGPMGGKPIKNNIP